MAVNFSNLAFGTKVTCSSVSTDGYEIENLLKPGKYGQMKGFLAEHFIKPPLSVTFTFPFKIDISSIIIDPNVGSQKSSGIEIFSATVPDEEKSSDGKHSGEGQGSRNQPVLMPTNIGKGYCNNVFPRLICFFNRRYQSRHKVPTKAPFYQEGTVDVLVRDIRCSFPACVKNVNQIIVKITRVHGASVPAMKKVEIWGQPALSCDKSLVQKIVQTVEHLQGLGVKQQKNSTSKEQQVTSHHVKKKGDPSSHGKVPTSDNMGMDATEQCPEEFVDPITCDIMVIPILLPSGHTVDQQTLEKHQKIEATWGRPPNDPFTGVPFSNVNKPIPNVKLKARLDRFLLMGGATFKDVPRTAGLESDFDTQGSSKVKTSVLIQLKQGDSVSERTEKSQVSTNNVTSIRENDVRKQKGKRKRTNETAGTSYVNEQYARISAKRSKAYGVHLVSDDLAWKESSTNGIKKDLGSHERAVSDSLDDALASTLASLPSYNKPSAASTSVPLKSLNDVCVNCRTSFQDSEIIFYTMPCDHLICRSCTSLKTHGIDCPSCIKTFKTSELSRVHKRVNSSLMKVV